jgi:hypothetical protein
MRTEKNNQRHIRLRYSGMKFARGVACFGSAGLSCLDQSPAVHFHFVPFSILRCIAGLLEILRDDASFDGWH